MKAAEVAEHEVCPSCRGRGWKYSGPRRSELATSAVLHGHSRLAGGTFTVRGKVSPGDYFWLEVEDEGGPWTPAIADPEPGHGFDIMRTLADDWGIEGDHDGRTIWARFDWPTP